MNEEGPARGPVNKGFGGWGSSSSSRHPIRKTWTIQAEHLEVVRYRAWKGRGVVVCLDLVDLFPLSSLPYYRRTTSRSRGGGILADEFLLVLRR